MFGVFLYVYGICTSKSEIFISIVKEILANIFKKSPFSFICKDFFVIALVFEPSKPVLSDLLVMLNKPTLILTHSLRKMIYQQPFFFACLFVFRKIALIANLALGPSERINIHNIFSQIFIICR